MKKKEVIGEVNVKLFSDASEPEVTFSGFVDPMMLPAVDVAINKEYLGPYSMHLRELDIHAREKRIQEKDAQERKARLEAKTAEAEAVKAKEKADSEANAKSLLKEKEVASLRSKGEAEFKALESGKKVGEVKGE